MSNTCFKRKLMSVVDDSSLDKLGEIKIVVPANVNDSYQIGCVDGKSIQIYSDSSVLSLDGSTYVNSITISSGNVRWWLKTTEETTINITDKYYIKTWGNFDRQGLGWIDLSIFEYSRNMTDIFVDNQQGVTGNADNIIKVLPELVRFDIPRSISINLHVLKNNIKIKVLAGGFVGNIEELRNCISMQNMAFAMSPNVEGNIKDFGLMTQLSSLGLFQCPGITGNLEELVATQRGSGRTSGSIGGQYLFDSCSVYFNGVKVTSGGRLSWTATTITFKGVTIDNDDVIIPE